MEKERFESPVGVLGKRRGKRSTMYAVAPRHTLAAARWGLVDRPEESTGGGVHQSRRRGVARAGMSTPNLESRHLPFALSSPLLQLQARWDTLVGYKKERWLV